MLVWVAVLLPCPRRFKSLTIALQALCGKNGFIANMKGFHELRNDPNADKVSGMSCYIHFGQISAQQMAVEVSKQKKKYRVSCRH